MFRRLIHIIVVVTLTAGSTHCVGLNSEESSDETLIPLLLTLLFETRTRSCTVSDFTATSSNQSVSLSYSCNSPDVPSAYTIFFTDDGSEVTSASQQLSTTETRYTHTGLTNGNIYQYRIMPVFNSQNGTLSDSKAVGAPDNWVQATSGTANNIHSVRYVNNQFIAIGSGLTILTSSDGITWSPQTLGCTPNSTEVYDVAHDGANRFRMVGSQGSFASSDDNGMNWNCTTLSTTDNELRRIDFVNSLWVVTGARGSSANFLIAISSDGSTYNSGLVSTSNISDQLYGTVYNSNSGVFATSGDDGRVIYCSSSCDLPANWTSKQLTANSSPVSLYGIAVRNSEFHLPYSTGVFSADGTFSTLSSTSASLSTIRRLHDSGSFITAVGTGGAMFASADGITYGQIPQSATTADLNGIACSSSTCVAGGDGGVLIYRTAN